MTVDDPTVFPHDHLIGAPVDRVDTPAALVDLDLFEQNAAAIHGLLRDHGKTWRPHVKAHKSPRLARLELAAGAIGVTCAKVSEAEVMVEHGLTEILIANEPATPAKWRRLAALQDRAQVSACVDAPTHLGWAARAATDVGVTIPLFIEVDVGMHRAGVMSPAAAAQLADGIAATPGVHLAGMMGYEGHLLAEWPLQHKQERCAEAMDMLVGAVQAVRAAGHEVAIVSSGGTGTYAATADLPGLTESQAGGGCLMDRFYTQECHIDLATALTLRTTVISTLQPERTVVDAGFKALGRLPGFPLPSVADRDDIEIVGLSAEHGMLSVAGRRPEVGEQIPLIPGYSDAMLCLHDVLYGHRDGIVTEVIPLLGRGKLT